MDQCARGGFSPGVGGGGHQLRAVPFHRDHFARSARQGHEVHGDCVARRRGGVQTTRRYGFSGWLGQGARATGRPCENHVISMLNDNPDLREFILPYDAVRQAGSPDSTLHEFLQSTYEAAADLAQWDRAALERTST